MTLSLRDNRRSVWLPHSDMVGRVNNCSVASRNARNCFRDSLFLIDVLLLAIILYSYLQLSCYDSIVFRFMLSAKLMRDQRMVKRASICFSLWRYGEKAEGGKTHHDITHHGMLPLRR